MQAYVDGIRSAALSNWISSAQMIEGYWSASSSSSNSLSAWATTLATGDTAAGLKILLSGPKSIICVR